MPARPKGPPLDGDLGAETTLRELETAIASRWHRKDPEFSILGMKRVPAGFAAGFSILRVQSEWIRDNLDVTFGTGGHGLVHLFIPLQEIWVDDVQEPMAPLALHEAVEYHHMLEDGDEYRAAHDKATRAVAGVSVTDENLEALICRFCPERKSLVEAQGVADARWMPEKARIR